MARVVHALTLAASKQALGREIVIADSTAIRFAKFFMLEHYTNQCISLILSGKY
jgi:hypothetical protein